MNLAAAAAVVFKPKTANEHKEADLRVFFTADN